MTPPRIDKKKREWISGRRCACCGAYPPNDPAHQSILGNSGMGMKPPDREMIPLCRDCHQKSETEIGWDILRLWKEKRPDLWVDEPHKADPSNGFLYDKHDLREWIFIQCESYDQLWKATRK